MYLDIKKQTINEEDFMRSLEEKIKETAKYDFCGFDVKSCSGSYEEVYSEHHLEDAIRKGIKLALDKLSVCHYSNAWYDMIKSDIQRRRIGRW